MSKEFEPYNHEGIKSDFSHWEFHTENTEEQDELIVDEPQIDEMEVLRQEAIEKGYAQGLQQASAEINQQKAELAKWFELIQKPVKLLDEQLTQEIIQTLLWLCKQCIGIELSTNPDQLHAFFNAIKMELPSLQSNKQFAMHPEDVAWVKSQLDEKIVPGLHELLVSDPDLMRGDFYLKGEHSELDGRLHTRLSSLFAKYIDKDKLTDSTEAKGK